MWYVRMIDIGVDGRKVVFAADIDHQRVLSHGVFMHDRVTGMTSQVSVGADGSTVDSRIEGVAISGDGRYVAFAPTSRAPRPVP